MGQLMYNSISNSEYTKIIPPTNCPSCDSVLELVNSQLFCRSFFCPAKSLKKIEHFAKTMKIKGLGQKTIEKLSFLEDISDIYELNAQNLVPVVGEKIAEKLLQEIEKSKTVDLATFIAAFSIPLFGSTAASSLSKIDFEYLEEVTYKDLRSVGIGDKAACNFIDWLQEEWVDKYCNLPVKFLKSSKSPASALGTVVITGTFSESRNVLGNTLSQYGFDIKDSISSKTKFLLVGESKGISSKVKKAEQLNIMIVYSVEELLQKANLE